MIDGNLAMANQFVNETEEQNNYWADVYFMAEKMKNDYARYPYPITMDEREECGLLNQRDEKITEIAKRFISMKYLNLTTRGNK